MTEEELKEDFRKKQAEDIAQLPDSIKKEVQDERLSVREACDRTGADFMHVMLMMGLLDGGVSRDRINEAMQSLLSMGLVLVDEMVPVDIQKLRHAASVAVNHRTA